MTAAIDFEVSSAEAESTIVEKSFQTKEGGMTICKLTLQNGHDVYGVAKVRNGSVYSQEAGEEVAYHNALKKVRELESYVRKSVGLDVGWWGAFKLKLVGKSA